MEDPKTGKDQELSFQIWDVAGQSSFTNFRHLYLKKAHGVFLVFDLKRPDTFNKLDRWFDDVQEQSPTAKIIVIGNKNDLTEKLPFTEEEILKRFQAKLFYTTSAKTGAKVQEAFIQMGQLILGE